ncbi:MAG TPA: ABC transporter ATP-binding protein [Geobacteraceae bacterium]
MTTPVFELKEVTYCYAGEIVALDGIDLAVRQGESVVILGANGSGKSTLLRLLDGLIFADQGTVAAFGEPLTEERLEEADFRRFFRSRVGFLFQNPDIQLFSPTVREEIAFGPLQLGLAPDEARQRVEDVLAWLGIGGLGERSPLQLSGGEKKKVAIAAVLAMNPEVLLLDEPTAALDPRSRHWFLDLAQELGRVGKTVVTATHDLDFAERTGTRVVAVGEAHRVVADGPPAEILSDRALLVGANLIHPGDPCRLSPPAGAPKLPPPYPFAAECKRRRW